MRHQEKLAFTTEGAAEALSTSRSQIYKLMKSGVLKYIRIGADRRIPRSEVERIAREGTGAKS